MGSIGMPEILLIFLVVLLVFGAKRIPEIARGLGKGIREFKDATNDLKREITVEDQYRVQPPRQGTTAPHVGVYQDTPSAPPPAATATTTAEPVEPRA